MNISMKTPRALLVAPSRTVLVERYSFLPHDINSKDSLHRKVPRRKGKKDSRAGDCTQKLSKTIENESNRLDDSDKKKRQGDVGIKKATSDAKKEPR